MVVYYYSFCALRSTACAPAVDGRFGTRVSLLRPALIEIQKFTPQVKVAKKKNTVSSTKGNNIDLGVNILSAV